MFVSSALLLFGAGLANAQPTFFVISNQGTMSQAAAQAACVNQSATLASLHSSTEYNDAKAKCQAVCGGTSDCGCWVGIKDDVTEGSWYNMDNSYPDYMFTEAGTAIQGANVAGGSSAWYSTGSGTEPNNAGGNEDCAHIWSSQSFWINDINCGDAGNYPLCRKTDENKQIKCAPGWDNKPIGQADEGECSVELACWGTNAKHRLGDNSGPTGNGYNDIPGCGMAACDTRYDLDTIEQCSVRCATTAGCLSYSWAPYSGDSSHPGKKTCTMYTTTTGTQQWETNQILCSRCDLSVPKAQQGNDMIDVEQPVQPDAPASPAFDAEYYNMIFELLAMNAAVSAVVSMVVVGVCLTACYACSRSTQSVVYAKVDKEDAAMNL